MHDTSSLTALEEAIWIFEWQIRNKTVKQRISIETKTKGFI